MTRKEKTRQQAGFTVAYHDYEAGLNRYSFFKVNDRGTSEDLVQATFMKTWRYIVIGGDVVIMKAFLYHILNNVIVDEYRRHKASSLDVLLEKGFEPRVDYSPQIINKLDGKGALSMIDSLPQKYQKVLRRRYIQALTLEEMSDITGQSKNPIAVQVHRGLELIKSLYKSKEENNNMGSLSFQ